MGLTTYGVNYNAISAPMGGLVSDLNFQIGTAFAGVGGGSTTTVAGGSGSGGGGGGVGSILFAPGLEQWRMPQTQQFPFLAGGLEGSPGLYSFEAGGEGPGGYGGMMSLRAKATTASGLITQLASVKMEDNNNNSNNNNRSNQEMNLSSQFLGSEHHNQYWGNANTNVGGGGSSTSAWTELSGFSSSSTTSNQL